MHIFTIAILIWGDSMLSPTLEKYLICMYKMLQEGSEMRISDIAKKMNQPLQKTIQALQRMHYQKQIIYSSYQPLKLTDEGKKMAEYLIAREELIGEFLKVLYIDKSFEQERDLLCQYLSNETLRQIEKFIMFSRQYPEVSERFGLFEKIVQENTILPKIISSEKKS